MHQQASSLRELQGESPLGWEQAAQAAIAELAAEGQSPHSLCITQLRARVEAGRIVRFHVSLQACCQEPPRA